MDISNTKRAMWAEAALDAWRAETGQPRSDSDAHDLVYDLLLFLESEGRDALNDLEDVRDEFESDRRAGLV